VDRNQGQGVVVLRSTLRLWTSADPGRTQDEEFVRLNLPQNNPEVSLETKKRVWQLIFCFFLFLFIPRRSYFTKPSLDTAVPGLSLITTQAPVYFTGTFRGVQYQDTYLASTAGVDIAVSAVSSNLDVLQDRLTPGSFRWLVDFDFSTVVILPEVVKRIYQAFTGEEDVRVTYHHDGRVLEDRRNIPYTPADTILQDLTNLTNANWTGPLDTVQAVPAGDRGMAQLKITWAGETKPTEYDMFDKWPTASNWTLLVFAPIAQV
jgi:hypothetical protein